MDEQVKTSRDSLELAMSLLDQSLYDQIERKDVVQIEIVARLVGGRLILRTLSLHNPDAFRCIEEICTKKLSVSPRELGDLLEKWDGWRLALDGCRDQLMLEDWRAFEELAHAKIKEIETNKSLEELLTDWVHLSSPKLILV